MNNKFYISFNINNEQIEYANKLVEYSLKHHPISNIWDKQKKERTRELRLTGTLGEVVFADIYGLERPSRSFGAIDGQDYGKDFFLEALNANIDVKSMRRKSNKFFKNYVLNIPARNIKREDSITDFYYCISLHNQNNILFASLVGYINKKDILTGKIGKLYKRGTKRIRSNNTSFTFYEDTYEILFQDINSPVMNEEIYKKDGFKKHILN